MKNWRAILFDVDGTLYHQNRLRIIMLRKLMAWSLRRPLDGCKTLIALRAYRRAQETLRRSGGRYRNLAEAQISEARSCANVTEQFLRDVVARWFDTEPLSALQSVRRAGLIECLRRFKSNSISLGVVSDYPAEAKLQSLGIGHMFDVVVSAQDAEVGEFKPAPRGLLVAAERLGISVCESAYVGDRVNVDANAARNAGMDCFIIGKTRSTCGAHHCVSDFFSLADTILGGSMTPGDCMNGAQT